MDLIQGRGGDGNVIQVTEVGKAFNTQIIEVFQGSSLSEIIDEMFTHMRTQVEIPALVNSRPVFNRVLSLEINFHQLNLTQDNLYLPLPDWITIKKAIINLQNEKDEECFKWAALIALRHETIENNSQ